MQIGIVEAEGFAGRGHCFDGLAVQSFAREGGGGECANTDWKFSVARSHKPNGHNGRD